VLQSIAENWLALLFIRDAHTFSEHTFFFFFFFFSAAGERLRASGLESSSSSLALPETTSSEVSLKALAASISDMTLLSVFRNQHSGMTIDKIGARPRQKRSDLDAGQLIMQIRSYGADQQELKLPYGKACTREIDLQV